MSNLSSMRDAGATRRVAPIAGGCTSRYELRFVGLWNPGRGYAFPCDAHGQVDLDSLAESARTSYFYARSVIGRELCPPVACAIADGDGETRS